MAGIMNNYIRRIIKGQFVVLLLLILAASGLHAQQITVKGKVTDNKTKEALPGVNIIVKGTVKGTSANSEGNYSLTVPSSADSLVFTYIGYQTKIVPISGRSEINVTLSAQVLSTGEIVVVGYGTQKKTNVTGAIGSISGDEVDNISTSDPVSLLQGKVPGVRVENGGGQPGGDVTVVIRGTGTFGNDQPLYVIDGNITNSMSFLNPDDIESMEVLKDASAAAIYGNRASNGVILITTKKGQAGKTKVNFSTNIGVQNASKTYDFLNARQYANYRNLANDNDGQPRAPANSTDFDPSINTDWQDLQINPAPIQRYNLSVSGGNDKSSYYLSGQYFDQEGLVVDEEYQRYNLRANSTFKLGKFDLEESLSASRSINNPNTYFGRERGALPTIPVYDKNNDGGFAGIEPAYHGVARGINWYGLALLNENRYTTDQIVGSVNGKIEIFDGLEYKLNLGLDYSVYHSYNYTPTFFFSTSQEAFNDVADLNEGETRTTGTLIENTLHYNKSIGNHNIDLLGGYTQQLSKGRSLFTQATDFPTNDLRVISAANTIVSSSGEEQDYALTSVLGRINYNFKEKYLLGATIRYDGSSRFTKENRWGTFPSISAGWRISNESFFPEGIVNELKIRGSYGELGSQNVGNYVTISGLNIYTDYYFAGGVQPGTALTTLANPNIVWETTKSTDIGADIGLMDDKITFTLDYFDKLSDGVLTNLPIPTYAGVGSSIVKNAASIKNTGFEFSGTYHYRPDNNGLQFSVTANFSTTRNNVEALGEGVSPITGGSFTQQTLTATRTAVGHPIASFYGFVVEGLYQNQDQIDADGRSGVAQLGDFNYKDLNGDGKINSDDKTFIGSYVPDFRYGLNLNASFKQFDMQLFVQGVQGNEIWNAKKFQFILDGSGGNKITKMLDAWTPDNRDTNIPRPTIIDPANNSRASTFYVEDGSYLRVKSLQIGYTIPASLTNMLSMSNAKIYLRGQNLLTLTKYSGYDPEIGRNSGTKATGLFGAGIDVEAQPHARIFSVGVDLSF